MAMPVGGERPQTLNKPQKLLGWEAFELPKSWNWGKGDSGRLH
jgi:hypothetical protein